MATPTERFGGRPRVLTVDDDPSILSLVRAVLSAHDYDVLTAGSGEEALDIFDAARPKLVLLDVQMPGMDGFAVCSRLRALPEGRLTPILFLTSLKDLATQQRALDSGADDLIGKPIQATELLMRVRSLLWMARLREETEQGHALVREQRNALLQLQQQKEELLQLVVHDLRSPLAAILANTRYLEVGDVPDMQDTLSDIRIAAETILQQVTNLLDLDKSAQGQLVPRLAPVDICALLQQACGQVRRHAEQRGQRLLLELEAELQPVHADAELLRRVVQNLLDNCLKYTPPASTVRIQARRRAEALELRVCDEGPGIPPEMRERVFEQRVRLGSTNGVGGYGLGLAFCRLAAEAHGGRIWVEDNQPTGSIFCLQLPGRDGPGNTT